VDGGSEPLWSPDGRELFYRRGRELMSVRVETERAFSAGAPTVLFSDPHYTGSGVHRQYDVTPDGQRFIMVRPVGAGRQSRLILVRNALSTLEGGASR
jgi:serine/threonine-protein kinase